MRSRWHLFEEVAISQREMKFPRFSLTCVFIGVGVLLLFFTLRPYPIVVARNCTILVQDSDGKPLAGVKVTRDWAYGSSDTLEERITGPDGTLTFDERIRSHSRLNRCLANLANALMVHGDSHITDAYFVNFPANYTAEIASNAPFKWIYDEGHFAQIELSGLPPNIRQQAKFKIKPKAP
jgi:hypothetical protein